jgi:signal transduction histidine kinase
MLGDGDAGPLNPAQQEMVEVIERNAQRLMSLIEDLLTLSRIEAGAFTARLEPTELAPVVSRAAASIAPSAKIKGVLLHVDVADGLGSVLGDDEQLGRALRNLLHNSVKFTPAQGEVTIRARRDGDRAVVTVGDNGIGIAHEEQRQLFTLFFRSSAAIREAIQGTGLGLVITKSIVEHHAGTIELTSTPGDGTTVTLTLPAHVTAR